jgi:hypothetical protein
MDTQETPRCIRMPDSRTEPHSATGLPELPPEIETSYPPSVGVLARFPDLEDRPAAGAPSGEPSREGRLLSQRLSARLLLGGGVVLLLAAVIPLALRGKGNRGGGGDGSLPDWHPGPPAPAASEAPSWPGSLAPAASEAPAGLGSLEAPAPAASEAPPWPGSLATPTPTASEAPAWPGGLAPRTPAGLPDDRSGRGLPEVVLPPMPSAGVQRGHRLPDASPWPAATHADGEDGRFRRLSPPEPRDLAPAPRYEASPDYRVERGYEGQRGHEAAANRAWQLGEDRTGSGVADRRAAGTPPRYDPSYPGHRDDSPPIGPYDRRSAVEPMPGEPGTARFEGVIEKPSAGTSHDERSRPGLY